MNERAAAGGADHQAEDQERSHDRYRHRGRQGEDDQEAHLHAEGADPPGLPALRQDRGEHQRPVEQSRPRACRRRRESQWGRSRCLRSPGPRRTAASRPPARTLRSCSGTGRRARASPRAPAPWRRRDARGDRVARSRGRRASENTPSPTSVLAPIRLAPAAPANDPFGIACAANAEPRRTVKNPTTPATAATMLATVHALTMKPENTAGPQRSAAAGSDTGAPAPPAERRRLRSSGRPEPEIDEEDQRDDEEAHRPSVSGGWPFIAVVGEHDPHPHDRDADCGGGEDREPRPPGEPDRARGRADQQGGREDRPDRDRRERRGEGQREQVEGSHQPHRDPPAAAISALTVPSSSGR